MEKSLEKSVARAIVCKKWARNNVEQTSFALQVAYRRCVFSVSSGDAEPSSEPYVTTVRRKPEAFYLLGHGR